MTFMRLKTDSAGRVYLYSEDRWREDGKVRSKSRSHGRVSGFWFLMSIIVDNFGDVFRTRANDDDDEEAMLRAVEAEDEKRERDKQKIWEITHPGWAAPGVPEQPVTPPAIEAPPAPHSEEPESAPPSGDSEAPEAPGDAPDPE
jgi:hypothetical protein